MNALLAATSLIWQPIPDAQASSWSFPEAPPSEHVFRGAEAFRKGKGIDRVWNEDRVSLGVWFDGRVKRDSEQAFFLSPGMVARWLGFLQAKEKWDDEELQSRWDDLRRYLAGRLTFIVQLAAYPKQDPLEDPEPTGRSDPSRLTNVRFLFTSGAALVEPPRPDEFAGVRYTVPGSRPSAQASRQGIRVEPESALLELLQARSLGELGGYRWYRDVPFGSALTPEFERSEERFPLPYGEFWQSWFWVTVTVPEALGSTSFELRIFDGRRERVARFAAPKTPSPKRS